MEAMRSIVLAQVARKTASTIYEAVKGEVYTLECDFYRAWGIIPNREQTSPALDAARARLSLTGEAWVRCDNAVDRAWNRYLSIRQEGIKEA